MVVSKVMPDSPAAEAGLQVTDVILGPPGEPFREPHALRELRAMADDERRAVRGVLESLGAWRARTLPEVLDRIDLSDPRSP